VKICACSPYRPSTQLIKGRFVHRVLGGIFMPPTRNYVMKSRTQKFKLDPVTGQLVIDEQIVATVSSRTVPAAELRVIFRRINDGDPFIPFKLPGSAIPGPRIRTG